MEVARLSQLPRHLEPLLERAAGLGRAGDFGPGTIARLLAQIDSADPRPAEPRRPAAYAEGHFRQVGDIVRMCAALDDQLTSQPYEDKPFDTILDELGSFAVFEGFNPDLVSHLRQLRCDGPLLSSDWASLPVQATIAQRVVRCLGSAEECEIADIEKLASGDPVMAGAIVRVANSAIYSPFCRISRIREAIGYIGTAAARRILLAAAVRPMFASAGLRRLWSHSLEMAQLCSALGIQSGVVGAEEGLLIGLVHDIGSLALKTLPATTLQTYNRLVERGCQPAYVEQILFHRDHGEIGAAILSQWNFPSSAIEAVRFHHQPERSQSPVASMVYLAEFWCSQDEDLPSFVRIQECTARTGISIEVLATARVRDDSLKVLGLSA